MQSTAVPDDAAGIVVKLIAARRAGNRDVECDAIRELRQRLGIELKFADDLEPPPIIEAANPLRLALTPEEAQQALQISGRHLWSLTKANQVPHVRLGRSVRYPVDALRRWIDERKQGGEAR